jgi:hypothetical protein
MWAYLVNPDHRNIFFLLLLCFFQDRLGSCYAGVACHLEGKVGETHADELPVNHDDLVGEANCKAAASPRYEDWPRRIDRRRDAEVSWYPFGQLPHLLVVDQDLLVPAVWRTGVCHGNMVFGHELRYVIQVVAVADVCGEGFVNARHCHVVTVRRFRSSEITWTDQTSASWE